MKTQRVLYFMTIQHYNFKSANIMATLYNFMNRLSHLDSDAVIGYVICLYACELQVIVYYIQ